MAERSYCYLAPFGGITRIRFKGFVQDVSANSAPPLSLESKKEELRSKRKLRITTEEIKKWDSGLRILILS
jgi:hypothetical protein